MKHKTKSIEHTNPLGVNPISGEGIVYFIRVVDSRKKEWRYIGKASAPASRLRAYANNISRIQRGLPRRPTPGQEPYRGVHLALAKALEKGWKYEFYPILATSKETLSAKEQEMISQLQCNLNGLSSWKVENFQSTELENL